jgi:uncharacterized protein (DUF111 family)
MKIYIDPRGGMAGDMFSAALIDAGADVKRVTGAMLGAARMLGEASIKHVITKDNSSRLLIEVEHHHGHLSSSRALHLLDHLFSDYHIQEQYRAFGVMMLRSLIKAEKIAHQTFDFEMDTHHHHHEHEGHGGEGHHHHSHEAPEAWLHEAQDILIDVMGAVMGLQELGAPVTACLTAPVSMGGGTVTFSHGTLQVPAPATRVMIEANGIPVKAGPLDVELFTPTGAALLSALSALEIEEMPKDVAIATGFSRGTKDLDIPPLKIVLV